MTHIRKEDQRRISRCLEAFEAGDNAEPDDNISHNVQVQGYVMYLNNALPAVTGTSAGVSTGANYTEILNGTLVAQTLTETIYNISSSTIAASNYVFCTREPFSGLLIAQIAGGASSGGTTQYEGKLGGSLSANGTVVAHIYGFSGASWVDTGSTITLTDRAGWVGTSGNYFYATAFGGEYRPILIGC